MISCLEGAWRTPVGVTLKIVNLEEGMPSVPQARARLSSEIRTAQQNGIKVLKLIHGYGSSGVGGDLRIALQSTIRQMAQDGTIRDCIYGENWRTSDQRSWDLLKRLAQLKDDGDLGKGNRGITLVVL